MTLANVFAVAPVVLDGLGAVVQLALVTWVLLFPVRVELFFGISCSQTSQMANKYSLSMGSIKSRSLLC